MSTVFIRTPSCEIVAFGPNMYLGFGEGRKSIHAFSGAYTRPKQIWQSRDEGSPSAAAVMNHIWEQIMRGITQIDLLGYGS